MELDSNIAYPSESRFLVSIFQIHQLDNRTFDIILSMKLRLAQLIVADDIDINFQKIKAVLDVSEAEEWVAFPEGMLSGYSPTDDEYIDKLSWEKIRKYKSEIAEIVASRKNSCIFGTAYKEGDNWLNAAIYMDYKGNEEIYKKVNLATLDRKCFTAGDNLDVFGDKIKFGIQICRDNAFPEQWKVLKRKGAQVVFHINNAIKENDLNRIHVLISRAFENQYFVVSINNAAKPQTLPSMVISSFGEVIFESEPQKESVDIVEIDLSEVKSDYLEQERRDVVEVVYKK